MTPRIETIAPKKLVGKKIKMCFSNNRTRELFQSFMPVRKQMTNNLTTDIICMQVYENLSDLKHFDPDTVFDKWAVIEVAYFNTIPNGMETYTLPSGLYAVFLHKGAAGTGPKTFQYIFETWLPHSTYLLDNRPHFEILGEKYKNDDPDSEEEICIPIKPKSLLT